MDPETTRVIPQQRLRRACLGVLLLTLFAQPAHSERHFLPLRSFPGPSNFGLGFGSTVVRLGDVDRDGAPDFAVGMPGIGFDVPGEVIVYSGRSSKEIYRLSNGEVLDNFGSCLAGGSDVDGDGVEDLVVGAPGAGAQPGTGGRGAVLLYSAATGALLKRWDGSPGAALGTTVAFVGDLDADGVRDVAAAAGGLATLSIYSSKSGALIHEILPVGGLSTFGASIEDVGDVTGDGVSDIAVGSPPSNCPSDPMLANPRFVWLADGASGQISHSLALPPGCGAFGESLASIDDVDGGSRRDLAIASSDGRGPDTLFIFSTALYPSASDTLLRAIPVDSRTGNRADGAGWHLAAVGDIEGTGGTYVAVGSPRAITGDFYAGAVALYSLAADSMAEVAEGVSRDEELGFAVSSFGDVNGDGRPDMLVGAPGAAIGSQGEAVRGGVAVYGYADLAPSHVASTTGGGRVNLTSSVPLDVYCEGAPGSYVPSDVVQETVRLRSATNVFRSIPSAPMATLATSDLDGDGTQEFQARFPKSELREFFRYARQPEDTMSVVIEGDLRDGRRLQASLFLTIETPPAAVARVIPNPVTRTGQLTFRTSLVGPVWLRVFDLQGRLVETVLSGKSLFAGIHDVPLGQGGSLPVPSGVYFYHLETPDGASSGRFVVVQ